MEKRQPGNKRAKRSAPSTGSKSASGKPDSKSPARRTSSKAGKSDPKSTRAASAEKRPFWEAIAKKRPVKREEEEPESPFRTRRPPRAFVKPATPPPPPPKVPDEPMRLNKYIAHCGICARRQAAEYVKEGHVSVNGEVQTNPGYLVQPGDKVKFKDKTVRLEEKKVYILMNKPKDIITTANDEKGRKTVLDLVRAKVTERIFPVGRLDRMTTGLLLLTNDGDLAKKLSHPSHKVQKVYQATLNKPLHIDDLERIRKGIQLDDGMATVDSLHYISPGKDEVEIGLHIGKNRIVRRIFEHLGYEVIKLDRTYFAGLTKKDIGRGHFRHLTEKEVIMLKHFK